MWDRKLDEFAKKAVLALGLGMIGILLYVTLRFEFSFALGAVVALLHDVIITLGVFSLIGGELSLVMVGAILTIAGYSINDTIVVFDRIREGLRHAEGGPIQSLMNTSINETLGRTILTGGTTLLSVGRYISSARRAARFFLCHFGRHTYRNLFVDFHRGPDCSGGLDCAGRASGEVLETEAINRI